MITYCIGSARQKREYFKSTDGVFLDNIEVLFCVSENGFNYFAYGAVPFSEFTIAEYLRYRRALCKQKVNDDDITALGLDPDKRMGRLSPTELRCVQFLERTCGATDKTVIINLDGARYTRKGAALLCKLLDRCKDAYVLVTDRRFEKRTALPHRLMAFGKTLKFSRPRFYAAYRLAKRIGATKIAVM